MIGVSFLSAWYLYASPKTNKKENGALRYSHRPMILSEWTLPAYHPVERSIRLHITAMMYPGSWVQECALLTTAIPETESLLSLMHLPAAADMLAGLSQLSHDALIPAPRACCLFCCTCAKNQNDVGLPANLTGMSKSNGIEPCNIHNQ